MLIRRMDELTLQVKNIKEDLTARVVRTEEGQCQMGAALRDIEASLLKNKELQESIHQEIASEDGTLQGGSHDQDVPDVDGQLPRGLRSSAMQKPIPFDGMVSWDSYKTVRNALLHESVEGTREGCLLGDQSQGTSNGGSEQFDP